MRKMFYYQTIMILSLPCMHPINGILNVPCSRGGRWRSMSEAPWGRGWCTDLRTSRGWWRTRSKCLGRWSRSRSDDKSFHISLQTYPKTNWWSFSTKQAKYALFFRQMRRWKRVHACQWVVDSLNKPVVHAGSCLSTFVIIPTILRGVPYVGLMV